MSSPTRLFGKGDKNLPKYKFILKFLSTKLEK